MFTHFVSVLYEFKMASAQGMRAHTENTWKQNTKHLPLEKVAERFGIPKNTLSSWKKNKWKIMEAYRSG